MDARNSYWVTGTVISDSGYPRKNALVKGSLFAGADKVGSATSISDYSGQYFLTFELDEVSAAGPLRVVLAVSAQGETAEFGRAEFALGDSEEAEHEVRLRAGLRAA